MSSHSPETPSAHASLLRTLELLWHGHTPSGRGPRPGLTLDQIVDTALAVADADGPDALSMRRVARELGVGTMSLYRYVPDKSVLVELVLHRVSAPSEVLRAAQGGPWRPAMEADAREQRATYLRHPWLVYVNWSRPAMGPNAADAMELTMAALADTPLSDREKIGIMTTLDAYVTGSVRQQILYDDAATATGIDDETFWSTQLPFMNAAMTSGDYPHMAELSEDAFGETWEETFERGLKHLLDGIERDLAVR